MWENDDFGGIAFHICEGSGAVLVMLQMQVASGQAISSRFTDTHVFLTGLTSLRENCAGGTHLD